MRALPQKPPTPPFLLWIHARYLVKDAVLYASVCDILNVYSHVINFEVSRILFRGADNLFKEGQGVDLHVSTVGVNY